jgi:putative membrane protein
MGTAIIMAATASLLTASVSPSLSEDAKPADTATSEMKLDKATWTKTVASANFFEIES